MHLLSAFGVEADGYLVHVTHGAAETKFAATTRQEAEDQIREFVHSRLEAIVDELAAEANRQNR